MYYCWPFHSGALRSLHGLLVVLYFRKVAIPVWRMIQRGGPQFAGNAAHECSSSSRQVSAQATYAETLFLRIFRLRCEERRPKEYATAAIFGTDPNTLNGVSIVHQGGVFIYLRGVLLGAGHTP